MAACHESTSKKCINHAAIRISMREARLRGWSRETFALLLLLTLSFAYGARKGLAIASPPQAPTWVQPGDYFEYNQTYSINGLTASILANETVLSIPPGGAADMQIQRYDPKVPAGFAEPGLVTPSDSGGNASTMTTVVSYPNGTTHTTINFGGGFTTDLTLFITPSLVSGTNASAVSLSVPGLGGTTIQAWRVNETRFDDFVDGPPFANRNPSLLWFERNSMVKVMESDNYTDPSGDVVVSLGKIIGTNVPQIATDGFPSSAFSSADSSTAGPSNVLVAVGAFVAVAVTMVGVGGSRYLRGAGRKDKVQAGSKRHSPCVKGSLRLRRRLLVTHGLQPAVWLPIVRPCSTGTGKICPRYPTSVAKII
jgi:hypothetical protein